VNEEIENCAECVKLCERVLAQEVGGGAHTDKYPNPETQTITPTDWRELGSPRSQAKWPVPVCSPEGYNLTILLVSCN